MSGTKKRSPDNTWPALPVRWQLEFLGTHLSPFPLAFANALVAAAPQLVGELKLSWHDTDDKHALEIVIPPFLGGTEPLNIFVGDGVVDAQFAMGYLTYGLDFPGPTLEGIIKTAVVELLELLSEERIVILGVDDDDMCVMCASCRVDRLWNFDDLALRTCIRSWRGTHNSGWTVGWPDDHTGNFWIEE